MKLKQPIFYLKWILIIFSSIAFILANIEAFQMTSDLSSKGFKIYLSLFDPYRVLFGALFVVITADLAIERLGLMTDSNANSMNASLKSFKASNRTQWIQTVKEFYGEIKKYDPNICKEITRKIIVIHDYLFDHEYKIDSKERLTEFFNRFFADRVAYFEDFNVKYMNIAFYKDDTQSYSFLNFRYIFNVMINADESYNNLQQDLRELYQEKVKEFSNDKINPELFESSVKLYADNRLKGTDLK